MTQFSDDFNRANSSTLGGSWVEDSGDFEIVTNAVRQRTATGAYRKLRYNSATATNDQYSRATINTGSDTSVGVGVFVRGATSGTVTYYGYVFFGGDNSYIVEITAGAETILATGSSVSSSTSYTAIRLSAVGSTLTGTRNGAADISTSDSSLTSGHVGIMSYGGTSTGTHRWDDWSGGDTTETISPSGVATAEAFGTAQLNLTIAASGVTSEEAFGTAAVSVAGGGGSPQTVTASAIASEEAFGTAQLNLTIAASGVATGETFGSAQLNLTIAASGVTTGETFGSALVALAQRVTVPATPAPGLEAGYALRFYGGGNSSTVDKVYIPCGPGDAINVGQGDFTIELWVRAPASLAAGSATAGANYSWINSPIIVDRDLLGSVGSGGDWGVSMTGGRITFGLENSAGSQRTIIGTTDLRDDTWHHVAVTRERSTGDMAIYVDGAREAYQASGPSGDVHVASDAAASTYNEYICLGGEKHAIDWPAGQWVGRLDEVRVSSSLRYTGTTYTVPSAPWAADASTVGLYHCDDGSGTTVTDWSGHANHGTFTVGGSGPGPTWEVSAAEITTVAIPAPTVQVGALTVSPSAIASEEAFGTAQLNLTISPSAIAGAETFGTAQLNLTIAASGVATGETFGTATVRPGVATISPTSITSEEAFGGHLVQAGVLLVAPTAIDTAEAFGTAVLQLGAVTLSPTAITSEEAFGSAVVALAGSPQTVTPSAIASEEAVGQATVSAPTTPANFGLIHRGVFRAVKRERGRYR